MRDIENVHHSSYNTPMTPSSTPPSFPDTFRIMTTPAPRRYTRQADLYAVHGPLPSQLRPDIEYTIEEDVLTICRGALPPSADLPGTVMLTPVYRLEPHGPLAVPTSRIYVRAKEGTSLEDHRTQLANLGYAIVEVPAYAPHTAWVQATTRDVGTSLQHFEQLTTLPDVEHVEPELLMKRSQR
ncbi:MAG TPA: hypothetical protein PKD12_02275 [Nitrospira sp.]|nr:hypothetical protein [Nitrospira sp.]